MGACGENGEVSGGSQTAETLDEVVRALHQLRVEAGAPSYADLAMRVMTLRMERGLSPAAARVARSSVYDVFRPGRTRVSAELVRDIALALGADAAEADGWRHRAVAATTAATRTASVPAQHRPRGVVLFAVVFAVACLGLNLFGNTVAGKFELPIWLDTIGTAVAALVLGPWHGVAVGVSTNLLATVSGHPESLAFAPVNAVAALVWGFGVRLLPILERPWRLVPLGIVVAVACTLTAAPITVLVIGGLPSHGSAGLIATFTAVGTDLWSAVFSANLLFSLLDKQLSTWIAFGLALGTLRLLPERTSSLSGIVRVGRRSPSGGDARG